MSQPLSQFLRELGFVLLEHRGNGRFALLSEAPKWLMELWEIPQSSHAEIYIAEKAPFLENFLYEADAFWNSDGKGLFQSETWVEKTPSGNEIPLEAIALHLEGKRFLALHSPESQYQQRVQLLQTARDSLLGHERLQREIQKKEILLHCIIHDLSQPLSVMSVTFDCMTDEHISNKGRNFLELGKKASDQQLMMIRDILQVFSADLKASLEAKTKPENAPDLLACANSVLASFSPVYASKNVRLQLDEATDQNASWRVQGEATRIERIFSNFLENALRYAPSGSTVTIGLAPDAEFIRALVDDEGPGLPADLSPDKIFALFSKGKEGGGKAGLGLYFCRLTVERWGGSIGCESLPYKGSRFWFRLPKASSQSPESIQHSQPSTTRNERKALPQKKYPMRILLADDQSEIRLLTTHQLERNGHHVVAVTNGQEALDALQREAFDVVLLDEDMPVMNGLEALRNIRDRQQSFAPMVVIALTGYNSEPDRERLLRAGFDSVIGKPFRLEALDALLHVSSDTPNQSSERKKDLTDAQSPVANVLERVGGDEKLARQMIAIFLHDTPQRLAGIQKALKQQDGEKLASFAHALKGSVSIFGAAEARNCAQRLQDMGRAGDFRGLAQFYEQLKEEIAKLEANLRGYARQKRSPRSGASPKKKRRNSNPKW
jgi:signal transduction histidine kinase/CheY-like chemotaxis protein